MEVHSSDVVQMSKEGEEAPAKLVVPHFYLVVVASGAQERFHGVEVDAANCAAKTKSKAGCLVNDSLLGLGFASWGKQEQQKHVGKQMKRSKFISGWSPFSHLVPRAR